MAQGGSSVLFQAFVCSVSCDPRRGTVRRALADLCG